MALHRILFDTTSTDTMGATSHVGAVLFDKVNGRLGVINAAQELTVHDADVLAKLNAGVTVSATNLDIRDLVFATDKVDASGSAVSITGTVGVTQSTSPWVVSATNLDIRDLTHVSDSLRLGDGTDLITSTLSGGKQGLDVYIAGGTVDVDDGIANTAILASAETVGTTIGQIVDGGDELASRKYLFVYNNGNRQAYIGQTGITTSTGFPVPPGAILEARIGAAVDVYMIADAASQNIRCLQLS